MGKISESIAFLSCENIVAINKDHLEKSGEEYFGADNIRNRKSLLWVLEIIQHPVFFNNNQYPTIFDKASLICWTIINSHTFYDGNKRTGMSAMIVFLRLNDENIKLEENEIVDMDLNIVDYRKTGITREELAQWLEDNTIN